MVILDVSIVNVALPSIREALRFSTVDLQWIVNAYTLTFAGFLLLGGRAADLLGPRRVFIAGLALFAVASLIGGLAQSQVQLVVARAVRKIRSGTSGRPAKRASIATKAASRAKPPPARSSVGADSQPLTSVRTIAKVTSTSPAVTVSAPATSKWRRCPAASRGAPGSSSRRAARTATAAIGTLTKRIHSHPSPSVRIPPARPPVLPPTPPIAPHAASASLRSAPSANAVLALADRGQRRRLRAGRHRVRHVAGTRAGAEALTEGFQRAFLVGGGFAFAGAVAALTLLAVRRPVRRVAPVR